MKFDEQQKNTIDLFKSLWYMSVFNGQFAWLFQTLIDVCSRFVYKSSNLLYASLFLHTLILNMVKYSKTSDHFSVCFIDLLTKPLNGGEV